MGKPRLTRGLGARVLCTAPRRGFPIVLFALSAPELVPFRTFLTRALRKKAVSVSGIMGNRGHASQRTNRGDYLPLEANIICLLLFFVSVLLITQHPAWFG